MKLQVERTRFLLIPDNAQDEAWIEEVLGLRKDTDTAVIRRENIASSFGLAYIKGEKR